MNLLSRFAKITTFIFDVDGVLTDGTVYLLGDGTQARRMHTKDGYALQLAVKNGYHIAIVSGGDSEPVRMRLNKLGVTDVFLGVHDKISVLDEYRLKHAVEWEHMLYMGDDIPDLTAMQKAGIACAPADASPDIKQIAHYISPIAGGMGCVRDVLEKVMRLNGHWTFDTYLSSK